VSPFPVHILHVPGADPQRTACVTRWLSEPDAQATLHLDGTRRGVVPTWADALASAASTPPNRPAATARPADDWTLIVQDDSIPLDNWAAHTALATHFSPSPVLGLFWLGDRWSVGYQRGTPYMMGHNVIRGVAVAYHRSVLPDIADFAAHAARRNYAHDDLALCTWMEHVARPRLTPAVTSRCIIGTVRAKSLVGHSRYDTGRFTIENALTPEWGATPASTVVHFADNWNDPPTRLLEGYRQ
jgi:hypothetical protein